jgi:hypothetical protein
MTWSPIAVLAAWFLGRGYATGTVDDRVKVVKYYCRPAMQAGALDRGEWNAVQALRAYGHAEGQAEPSATVMPLRCVEAAKVPNEGVRV